ncbi:UNVERIFIED_CONTAM: hypothetical protein K2H54_007077 [Gekko kuhli]
MELILDSKAAPLATKAGLQRALKNGAQTKEAMSELPLPTQALLPTETGTSSTVPVAVAALGLSGITGGSSSSGLSVAGFPGNLVHWRQWFPFSFRWGCANQWLLPLGTFVSLRELAPA